MQETLQDFWMISRLSDRSTQNTGGRGSITIDLQTVKSNSQIVLESIRNRLITVHVTEGQLHGNIKSNLQIWQRKMN